MADSTHTPIPSAIPDPIFAAIERHRAAFARLGELDKSHGRTAADEDIAVFERANAAEEEALSALLETVPTSIAGIIAALKYLLEFNDDDSGEAIGEFVRTLVQSPLLAEEALS